MAIISAIGRRSLRVRSLLIGIYAVLGLGAVTMLYPFLLMLAGTTKSSVDTPEAEIIPRFLVDDLALYRKDTEGFFNEALFNAQNCMLVSYPSFRHLEMPERPNAFFAAEWGDFIGAIPMPPQYREVAYAECPSSYGSIPSNLRKFKRALLDKYGNIESINRELGTDFLSTVDIRMFIRSYLSRMVSLSETTLDVEYNQFKETIPVEQLYFLTLEPFYRSEYLQNKYGRDIDSLNTALGTGYASWDDVKLPRRYPEGEEYTDAYRADWEDFVRNILGLLWLRVDSGTLNMYREYLAAKYLGNIASLNGLYKTEYADFNDIPLPAVDSAPRQGGESADWDSFVRGWEEPDTKKIYRAPVENLYIHSVDFMFQDYLAARHGAVEKFNLAAGTSFTCWSDVRPPQRDFHYLNWFLPNRSKIRWEFTIRNYITVAEFILLQGRALYNTFVFCLLTIVCSLIVNPLAAYALSRYKPPSTYKVLLFLMMTMAFPPMVTQIPNFLMLRQLGLLNTFAALVLPGMANGYSIFLLKGFFDSLPKELYESAEIDGAGEFRIFWNITMSLSTPILAVIALNAFNAAYGNFMMALLVCQDQNMWTLMPWLYQLQMNSQQGLIFASLVIAALPTFLVFVFCQNIIMRGIVVPVEK